MPIIYRTGNLLTDGSQVLVNAVNRRGFMGAGIALAFKEKYPEMFENYCKLCRESVYDEFNAITYFTYPSGKPVIANLQTVNDELKGEYSLVFRGIQQLKDMMLETNLESVAIPPLGCGIGGLEKEKVLEYILETFKDTKIEVNLYNF